VILPQKGEIRLSRADLFDGAVAASLAALCVGQWLLSGTSGGPFLVTAGVASVLPLAVRRRWPLIVTFVVVAAIAGQLLLGAATPAFASFLAVMVVCYSLGRHATLPRAVIGLLLVAAAVVVSGITGGAQGIFDAVYPLVYLGGAVVIGTSMRARQIAIDRERDQTQRLAAAQERARIARELHDVVAHGLSLMVLQAEGAEAIIERDPARAKAALERIQQAGRSGVDEMRRMLDVLRTDDVDPAPARQRGLDGIRELVADARSTGVPVRLSVTGEQWALEDGVALALYRIVQEALTNAIRYGDGRGPSIVLDRTGDRIRVQVRNGLPSKPVTAKGTGRGLAGAQERVSMYGGELRAGVLEIDENAPEYVLDATLVCCSGGSR